MTLRIEKDSNGQTTTIRLIGRMQREHIEELKAQITAGGASVTLDLNEVGLVDLDVIRFLATCQTEGISLVHCSRCIDDWIAKERFRVNKVRREFNPQSSERRIPSRSPRPSLVERSPVHSYKLAYLPRSPVTNFADQLRTLTITPILRRFC